MTTIVAIIKNIANPLFRLKGLNKLENKLFMYNNLYANYCHFFTFIENVFYQTSF